MSAGPEQPLRDAFLRQIASVDMSWSANQARLAAGVLPASPGGYSMFAESFQGKRAEWTDSVSGAGSSIVAQPVAGGAWRFTAGGGGVKYATTSLGTTSSAPASFDAQKPFYLASRFKVVTHAHLTNGLEAIAGTGAAGLAFIALGEDPTQFAEPKLVLEVQSSIAPDFNFISFDTGIVLDTAWHTAAMYCADGVNIFVVYDGRTLGPFPSTTPGPFNVGNALGGVMSMGFVGANNLGSDASACAIDIDEAIVIGAVTP